MSSTPPDSAAIVPGPVNPVKKQRDLKLLVLLIAWSLISIFILAFLVRTARDKHDVWHAEQIRLASEEEKELQSGSLVGQDVSVMNKFDLLFEIERGSLEACRFTSDRWDRVYEPVHSPGQYYIGVVLDENGQIQEVGVEPNATYTF